MADTSDTSIPLLPLVQQQKISVANTVALTINYASLVSSSAPVAPTDGQVWVYEDAANHVRWLMVYRLADNFWYFVGGAPLVSEITTSETSASAAYTNLATVGPAIALPFAGDYDVIIGFNAIASVYEGLYMSYAIGGTGAGDIDAAIVEISNATTWQASVVRHRRKTGLTAVTLTAKYKAILSAGALFQNRFISVTPVRLNG